MSKKHNLKKNHVWFALLIGASVVMFWRGLWGLMDLYIFPDNLAVSYSVSLLIGLGILYVTHYIFKELL